MEDKKKRKKQCNHINKTFLCAGVGTDIHSTPQLFYNCDDCDERIVENK